jgi:molybdate transport system substrate-binding protein
VLWTRKDAHLPEPNMDLLRSPLIKHLAIANPDRAPYGKAAVAFLQKTGLYQTLKPKFVVAENIAQAAQFVDSGNAEAGLISMTSALTPRLAADGRYFVIPPDQYPPIEQGAVLLSKSPERVAAKKFLTLLMSAPVQEQLRKFGLTPGRADAPPGQ